MKTKGGELADDSLLRGSGTMMIVPPLTSSHTLSHEQVMPFLKKLEQGQLREGVCVCLCVCVCVCVCVCACACACTGRYISHHKGRYVMPQSEEEVA